MAYHNAHAALVDDEGIVRDVIVIPFCNDDDAEITAYCNSIGLEGTWLDCSYVGSRRSVFPAVGDRYDSLQDIFVAYVVDDAVTPERLEELANAGFQE